MLLNQTQRFIANKFPKTCIANAINSWIAKKKFLRELVKHLKYIWNEYSLEILLAITLILFVITIFAVRSLN